VGIPARLVGVKSDKELLPNSLAQAVLLRRGDTRGLFNLGFSLTVAVVTNDHVGFLEGQGTEEFRRNGVTSFTIFMSPIIRRHFSDVLRHSSLAVSFFMMRFHFQ